MSSRARDAWAGERPHALRLRIGPRPPRPLLLDLEAAETHDAHPPTLTVGVNQDVVTRVATLRGTGRPDAYRRPGVRSQYRTEIPEAALRNGRDLRIRVANESGSWIMWKRIRLIEAGKRLAWTHLTYRVPPRGVAAALAAGSLVVLLIPGPDATRPGRRLRGFARPAASALALILLGSAATGRGSVLASMPRWAWLAPPWLLLLAPLLETSREPAAPGVPHAGGFTPPRVPARSVLTRALPNLLLLVLSVAGTLLACELVTRRVFPEPTVYPA
jgi:hypothetical protein